MAILSGVRWYLIASFEYTFIVSGDMNHFHIMLVIYMSCWNWYSVKVNNNFFDAGFIFEL